MSLPPSAREIRRVRDRFIFAAALAAVIMALMYTPDFAGKKYLLWALATPVQFWAGCGSIGGPGAR